MALGTLCLVEAEKGGASSGVCLCTPFLYHLPLQLHPQTSFGSPDRASDAQLLWDPNQWLSLSLLPLDGTEMKKSPRNRLGLQPHGARGPQPLARLRMRGDRPGTGAPLLASEAAWS